MIKLSRISRFGLLCAAASVLSCMQVAYAQSQGFFWEPEDPPYYGYPQIGAGVAVCGRTAAVGAPYFDLYANPDSLYPVWEGLVNVYTTDAERTRWTLLTVLHADDASPENAAFGKAIALQGRLLVISTNATLRIYERRLRNYELLNTVVLSDATIPESAQIQFEKDVLAIGVVNYSGEGNVRLFRINQRGKADLVASLSPPGEPDLYDFGGMSLDADARTLAIGLMSRSGTRNRVYLYQPQGGTWRHTQSVTAPSSTAAGFGSSVALRGNRLVVGAPGENLEFILQENGVRWGGAVHVYRRANNRWVHVQRLASNDPAQPSYGLVGFGSEIVTNARYFWITAPGAHDQFASTVQEGPASLYRWNAGHLELVTYGGDSLPRGGIDMTRRYVIEGDIYGGIAQLEGAHVVDLSTLVPSDIDLAD
jgi:hypothetical protein